MKALGGPEHIVNIVYREDNQAADSTFSPNEQQLQSCNECHNQNLPAGCAAQAATAAGLSEPKRCEQHHLGYFIFQNRINIGVHIIGGRHASAEEHTVRPQPVLSGFQFHVSQILIDLQPHQESASFLLQKAARGPEGTCAVEFSGAQAWSERAHSQS